MKFKPGKLMLLLTMLLICIGITVLSEFIFHVDIVYTHLFYIPIIISGLWYEKKALFPAIVLGIVHIAADYLVKDYFNAATILRSIMFCVIALTVGTLREKIRAGEALKQVVKQKELHLMEFQHRVKNNLNIISSLLGLEADNFSDIRLKTAFMDAQSRLHSLSSIYEQYYSSSDLDSIDLNRYVGDLAESTKKTFNSETRTISIISEIEEIRLDSKRSVPIGMILNELLTNSLKYAYPSGAAGEIRINLAMKNGMVTLSVSDDGKGFPGDYNPESSKSMGLRLVKMLVKQIHGEMIVEKGRGVSVSISFPV